MTNDWHVVTGATSGIGRAIACALATAGRAVIAVGRRREELDGLERRFPGRIAGRAIDLLDDQAVAALSGELGGPDCRVRALIHCAGVYARGPLATATVAELDALYRTNLRAPFLLTQSLLAPLERGSGYVIFLNSSAAQGGGGGAGLYAALQHASRAIADRWRAEINDRGIRVLSIFPGRTNTPRVEWLFKQERRLYSPELLLQPEDIASFVATAISLPPNVELTDISLRPARKSY